MKRGDLHILPTENRPEFLFKAAGVLTIRGRALLDNQDEVTIQISNWIDTYIKNPAEITYVIIGFEYLNSFSTVILVNILKKLSRGIIPTKKLVLRWYYKEDPDSFAKFFLRSQAACRLRLG